MILERLYGKPQTEHAYRSLGLEITPCMLGHLYFQRIHNTSECASGTLYLHARQSDSIYCTVAHPIHGGSLAKVLSKYYVETRLTGWFYTAMAHLLLNLKATRKKGSAYWCPNHTSICSIIDPIRNEEVEK